MRSINSADNWRTPMGSAATGFVIAAALVIVGSDQFPPDPFGCTQRGAARYRLKVARDGFNAVLTLVDDDEWAP